MSCSLNYFDSLHVSDSLFVQLSNFIKPVNVSWFQKYEISKQ